MSAARALTDGTLAAAAAPDAATDERVEEHADERDADLAADLGGTPEAVVYAATSYLIRGADLRAMREQVGLTVREMAARIDYSYSQVAAWERGVCRVPRSMWPRILGELRAEWRAQEEWRTFLGSLHLPTPVKRSDA